MINEVSDLMSRSLSASALCSLCTDLRSRLSSARFSASFSTSRFDSTFARRAWIDSSSGTVNRSAIRLVAAQEVASEELVQSSDALDMNDFGASTNSYRERPEDEQ